MGELSSDLISQFVKATNDSDVTAADTSLRGSIVEYGENLYVKLDGSDELTPVVRTVEVSEGDRVEVSLKNHTATVTGNTSNPAIGIVEAGNLRTEISQTADTIRLEAEDTAAKLQASINVTASEIRNEVSNEVAGLNSTISQTASTIRQEVKNTANGLQSSIDQNASSITTIVKNQNEFSQFQQTVEGFSFMGTGGTVKIQGGDINLTGAITWSSLSTSVQNEIDGAYDAAFDAQDAADAAQTDAEEALTTISGFTITEGSKTYIDGEMIYTDTIYVDSLHLGGLMAVHKTMTSSVVGGYIGYDSGFNSDSGIGIRWDEDGDDCAQVVCSNQAARLSWGSDTQVVTTPTNLYLEGYSGIYFDICGDRLIVLDYAYFRPMVGETVYLGSSSAPWEGIWSTAGKCTGSDRKIKNSIEDLPDKYITLFDNLRPVRYKLNSGTSGRYHAGYIAQEVEEAMATAGVDSQEFGGFVKDVHEETGEDIYYLRYEEFIAVYAAKIKQLESRYTTKIEELESRIAALEAKLNET